MTNKHLLLNIFGNALNAIIFLYGRMIFCDDCKINEHLLLFNSLVPSYCLQCYGAHNFSLADFIYICITEISCEDLSDN